MQWLLANSGPAIRFQMIVDMLQEQDVTRVSQALDDLHRSPIVSEWMARVGRGFEMKQLHSSNPLAFENVMGKLGDLGLRAGLQPFDTKTLPFRVWLSEGAKRADDSPFRVFLRTLVASFLSFVGYGDTEPVHEVLVRRLKSLYSFAVSPSFQDIYTESYITHDVKQEKRKHRFLNPDLYFGQQLVLPWVHDIRGLAHSRKILDDPDLRHKAETVVSMVFSPEYQDLPLGYGLIKHQERSYVIGWSVHLPGFESLPNDSSMPKILLLLQSFASFRTARESDWFLRMMEILEGCSTEYETYRFPKEWLPEKNAGYWVNGAYMALEDDRQKKSAIECESTFRMLKIKHLMTRQ